jgi:hypothetical protein
MAGKANQTATEASAVPEVPHVITALGEVRAAINLDGISKADTASGDGVKFNFRGIDAVLNAFSGPMVKAGLMILPSYSEPALHQRTTGSGKANYNYLVKGTFTALSTKDGSVLPLGDFYGEANDTQDKAVAKAQSIAMRQAYLQTFSVPLGPDMDPESGDSGGEPREAAQAATAKQQQPQRRDNSKPAAEGQVVTNLTDAQKRILDNKLKASGKTMDQVAEKFGKVDTTNYNDVMVWAKQQ